MEFRVLGPVEVTGRDGCLVELPGAGLRSVLALLLVHAGETVGAERMIDELWSEDPPAGAANALQARVSKLRRVLRDAGAPDDVLATRARGYVLAVPPEALDAGRFERLAREGREALALGDHARAAARLRDALELWRGPAFADVAHEAFVAPEATRLDELRLTTLEDCIEAELALGQHGPLVGELDAHVARHPLRERLRGQQMLALYRSGRQADSLRAYQSLRAVLGEELGLEPGPELRRLEAAVLAQDPSLDLASASGTAVTAVGAAQGSDVEAAPPASHPEPEPARRTNLRPQLSSFVGRARDVALVADLLDEHRLVTLVGPGGAGKTRLASEVAAGRLDGHRDGVWMLDLAPIGDPADLVITALDVMGLQEAGDLTTLSQTQRAPALDRLVHHLERRNTLLVFDNCEHVITESAVVAESLLRSCPDVRILATSREGLGVPGEALWSVPPLQRDDAVRLFVERAIGVAPAFVLDDESRPLVEEICRRLDGMPLAIELAAARTRGLSLPEIVARLDDRFRLLRGGSRTAMPRQQTLRAVVDWSYDLLFADERQVFDRLSVFAGGCTIDAAEAVCAGDEIDPADVVDLLARLVDKSLVSVTHSGLHARYRLLQTLSDYGREKLVDSEAALAVRDRHAHYYRELTVQADLHLRGSEQRPWIDRVSAELENIKAAIEWLVERGDAESAVTMVAYLGWYWWISGQVAEGIAVGRAVLGVESGASADMAGPALGWTGFLLAIGGDPVAGDKVSARAWERAQDAGPARLGYAGLLRTQTLFMLGRRPEAAEVLARSRLALAVDGALWPLAIADVTSAILAIGEGQLRLALDCLHFATERFREAGEDFGLALSLGQTAEVLEMLGDYEPAATALEECIALLNTVERHAFGAAMIAKLGNIQLLRGDTQAAISLHRDALARARSSSGITPSTGITLTSLSLSCRYTGRLDEAASLLEEARVVFEQGALPLGLAYALTSAGFVAEQRGDVIRAFEHHRAGLDVARQIGDERSIALALEGLAGAHSLNGDASRAARLLGLAGTIRERTGGPLPPGERFDVDRIEARCRASLGDDEFVCMCDAGRCADVDELVDQADDQRAVSDIPADAKR